MARLETHYYSITIRNGINVMIYRRPRKYQISSKLDMYLINKKNAIILCLLFIPLDVEKKN